MTNWKNHFSDARKENPRLLHPGDVATSRLHDQHSRLHYLPPWNERETPAQRMYERGGDDYSKPGPHPRVSKSREVKATHLPINVQLSRSDDQGNSQLPNFLKSAIRHV